MHEQRGTFNGIDTCSLTTFRQFNFTSTLHGEAETRAIVNRPDINSLLYSLTSKKFISKYGAELKRQEAKVLTEGIDFNQYYYGSTFIPVHTAMQFQHEMDDHHVTVIVNNTDNQETNSVSFWKF